MMTTRDRPDYISKASSLLRILPACLSGAQSLDSGSTTYPVDSGPQLGPKFRDSTPLYQLVQA